MVQIPTSMGRRRVSVSAALIPCVGLNMEVGLWDGWEMEWLCGVLAGRDSQRLGGRAEGGTRGLALYPAFLSFTLGLEA